jgi:hypothetical protein
MNQQIKQILELGLFFAGAVIVLDAVLFQMQVLTWFGLGLIFLFVATIIVASVARTVPTQKTRSRPLRQREDSFRELADIVNAAVYVHEGKSLRLLWERVNSLALSTVAAETGLSKKEISELANSNRPALDDIVRDEWMISLLADHKPREEPTTEDELGKILTKIENWSH